MEFRLVKAITTTITTTAMVRDNNNIMLGTWAVTPTVKQIGTRRVLCNRSKMRLQGIHALSKGRFHGLTDKSNLSATVIFTRTVLGDKIGRLRRNRHSA